MPGPRTGCRGFSRAYDRLLAERVYRSGTVDAVVQDCAVEVCDATLGTFMRPPDARDGNVTELRRRRYYVHERFLRHLSVSEYSIRDAARYDYGLSRCNEYYRRRLSTSWNEASATME